MTSSNVVQFHDHKIEKLLTEIKHGLAVHVAARVDGLQAVKEMHHRMEVKFYGFNFQEDPQEN